MAEGIDCSFAKGGTVIEVRSKAPTADLAAIRETVSSLELGDVEVQGIGQASDVLIRVATQPGGDAAQQAVVQKVSISNRKLSSGCTEM